MTGPDGQPLLPSAIWVSEARKASGVRAEVFALFAGTNAFYAGATTEDCPFDAVAEHGFHSQWQYGHRIASRGRVTARRQNRDQEQWWQKW